MTADSMQPTPAATPAAGGRSVWTNIRDVIFTPSATFQDVGQRPRWLVPLLIVMALTVVTSFLLMPMSVEMQKLGVQGRDLSADESERAMRMIETLKWIGLVAGPIMVAIFSAVYAVFFWAWAAISGAKNASFGVAFASNIYAGFILILQAFAQAVVVMVKGAEQVALEGPPTFGLALFLERGDMSRWLWGFLANVNFFTIWHAVAIAIAGIYALRMSKGSAYAFAIFVWLINVLWLAMQSPAAG